MRIGTSFQPSVDTRGKSPDNTATPPDGPPIRETFRKTSKDDLLRLEARVLFVAAGAAAGVYAGYNQGIMPGIVGAGVAGIALAKHGAELGNAAAGGQLPGAIVGMCTGAAGLALGAAAGSGILTHLTGINVDPKIAAGLLGATGAYLAYSAGNSKD